MTVSTTTTNAGIVLANILAMTLLKERHAWRWRLTATVILVASWYC